MQRFFPSPLVLLLLLAVGGPVRAANAQDAPPEKTPIQATDLFKIRQIEDVAVAPGGRSVVYAVKRVVQSPDSAGGPAYRTHLWRADAGGRGEPRQLTFGEQSAYSPAWHPDGDRLAFVREGPRGSPQIHILPTTGGESYRLTDASHGAAAPSFAPDGRRLLFASRLPLGALREATGEAPPWGDARPLAPGGTQPDPDGTARQVRAYLDAERPGQPRVTRRLDFQGERDLAAEPSFRHLFTVRASARPPEPGAFPEATRITEGFASFGGGSWLRDGTGVVTSSKPQRGTTHPDRVRDRDLFVAGADGSGQRPLLSLDGYALSAPRVSPEGAHVAFSARRLDDAGYAQGEIGLFRMPDDAAGRTASTRLLTDAFDRSAGPPRWSPDGWALYTTAPSEGAFPLYRFTPFARDRADAVGEAPGRSLPDSSAPTPAVPASGALAATLSGDTLQAAPRTGPERLTGPRAGVRAFDVGGTSVFYVATRPENPFELYARTPGTGRMRRLTGHNTGWLAQRLLSTPEPFTVPSDSFTIDGWTMRPATERRGRAAPLLVQIHGGPMAMWGPGEATMWHEFQYFAAQGYALVYANPRGSGGYGQAFKQANERDWGRGPARDVLAAADYAAALDWTDARRQVLTGGSYGGYLTAWMVAHAAPERFRAAVAQRGVYDLATFLGEGNAWRLVPYHFGGFPWEGSEAPPGAPVIAEGGLDGTGPPEATALPADTVAADTTAPARRAPRFASAREALIENSPLTYVEQIRTPLLIMHADEDLRTGVSQSEMLYRSLKVLGRPVEYARYPEAGHDLSRTGAPSQRLDRILRMWAFFERHL